MSEEIMPMTDPRPVKQRGQGSGATDAALLFDEPGPRGRILIAVGSVFAVLGIAALAGAVLYRLDLAGQLDYPEWRYFLGHSVVDQLLEAAGTTLSLGDAAAVLTFPLGIALGWLRLLDNRPVRWLVGLWIDAMRAVPMLLLVYFFLLVVPRFATVSDFWKLALPIVMCTSATTAEVFRSGVRALDRGQTEASLALGATRYEMIRQAVLPFGRSGIISASMLGLGRALGETMAVLMILSPGMGLNLRVLQAGQHQTIAANIASQFREAYGLSVNVLIATGLVLFIITFAVNSLARWIIARRSEFSGAS